MKLSVVTDVWRLLRELDLEAIRDEAQRPFRLLVLAQDAGVAADLAAALSGGAAHPWLVRAAPGAMPPAPVAGEPGPEQALVVFRGDDDPPELRAAVHELRARGLDVLACALGATGAHAEVPRGGERSRLALPDLGPGAVGRLAAAVVAAHSGDRRLALARALPPLREVVVGRLIDEAARANATYAFTAGVAENVPVLGVPLTVADMVVLTKNQLMMAYRIALCAGKQGAPRDVLGEFLGVIGGGFLFRQASRQLVGLIPVAGLPAKVAVAWAGTVAVGRAAQAWASKGDALTPGALRGYYREAKERGAAYFRELRAARGGAAS